MCALTVKINALTVQDSVQMLKYTIKCEKQELFIGVIPFKTIYALLL